MAGSVVLNVVSKEDMCEGIIQTIKIGVVAFVCAQPAGKKHEVDIGVKPL